MTLETSFETGRDLLFWIWPLSTVTPFLKHGVRQPLKSVKVIVLNIGIFCLLRTCSASFDHLIGEKTRMYFAKSLSDSIMNSYSLLPTITILIMQSTSMALQRI